ncbi:MAG: ATP-binding protein [Pseudomonadota bacterium]
MDTSHSRMQRYVLHLWLTVAVAILLAASFAAYVSAEKRIDQANELRQQSLILIDQMRQSSDDLSRMARTFVATGEGRYREHFREILAIRDGTAPRPLDYGDVYWDLVLADDVRPRPYGPALSLHDLLQQAGASATELALFDQAKAASDALARLEWQALMMPDRTRAATLLHDAAYHRAKAAIMYKVSQMDKLGDVRTLAAVRLAELRAMQFRVGFIVIALALIILVLRMRNDVHHLLGGSLHEVARRLAQLGGGAFPSGPASPQGGAHSVMRRIGETHNKLALIDAGRRRAEQELADYGEHLEALVTQRTSELETALQLAQAANRAKSAFLSNMSHELRTPLHAVIGFSGLLERSCALGDEDKKNLRIIERAGKHLLTLINDVLELSKIEAGQIALCQEACDVAALAEEVMDMLQQRAEQGGLRLTLECAALPPSLQVDSTKLRQVLINLVGNAIKFTRRGGVLLRIDAQHVDAQSMRLGFVVQDSGIGIAPEHLQQIFGPFVQMETHATSAGTGLGLSISRQYLVLLGGELLVESTLGVGSVFRFSIDCARSADMPAQVQPEALPEQVPAPLPSVPLDVPALAALRRELLQALEEAIRALNEEQLDMVLAAIAAEQPALAGAIRGQLQQFRHRELCDLLQQVQVSALA